MSIVVCAQEKSFGAQGFTGFSFFFKDLESLPVMMLLLRSAISIVELCPGTARFIGALTGA